MSEWVAGNTCRLTLGVADAAGAAADPSALRVRVRAPGGTVTLLTYGVDAAVVRDGLGAYHADVVLAAAGRWGWRLETDNPSGVLEGNVVVSTSEVL